MDTTNNISTADEQISNNIQPSPLLRLPCDLQHMIFDHLNPVDSTCIGLSSKALYAIYRRRFKDPLPLYRVVHVPEFTWSFPEFGTELRSKTCPKCFASRSCFLHCHIEGWFGEKRHYCFVCRSFVHKPETYKDGDVQLCKRHLACYDNDARWIKEVLNHFDATYAQAYSCVRYLRRI
ncbi:hypothetical protein FPOAC1_010169 [Fusarium poae]|uniref:hypothetical protein n=1 Tax=Fusarium poae TaxID=36050 RepID=UPI001CE73120|nr:hypothetical protein FPOAC1_010169 [Fusarium poae]KAG8665374.1 hypothetical protein FPOAC1_010169 [Fusarium poae]